MDLLNNHYKSYYDKKTDLADKFNIDATKEWVLFISSFTYTNMTKETYDEELKCYGERLNDFKEISTKSKVEILIWMEEALKLYPNKIFIYRPHPSEKEDERLNKLEITYNNFKIISELSVKQWIKTSEIILTWYSTSAAEVYFSGKNCHILRPFEIPYEWEVTIYNKSTKITKLNVFLNLLVNKDEKFPLNLEVLNSYYNINLEESTTNKICDLLVQMIKTDKYDMKKYKSNLMIYIFLQRLRHRLTFLVKENLTKHKIFYYIFNTKYLRKKLDAHISIMNRMNVDKNKNIATKEEVEIIINKINNSYSA